MVKIQANSLSARIGDATFKVATALPKPEHAAAWECRADILAEWLLAEFNRAQQEAQSSNEDQVEVQEDQAQENA